MKKLHKLIIGAYFRPFSATFFIVSFILLMLFLFKYINELVGKGLDWWTIVQLLGYNFSVNVPLALPLAILLASIMAFGSMGEQYELVAIKASGISIAKAMRPLLVVMIMMSVAAFYFSNIVMPHSFLKMASLLYDVKQKKATFNIPEGVFYNDIDGFSIRVMRKDPDEKTIYDIMIYDHTSGLGNTNVILAEYGEMTKSADESQIILKLFNGVRYQEEPGKSGYDIRQRQTRIRFKEYVLKFDLDGFDLSRTREELFKDNYQMLNIGQLKRKEDSIRNLIKIKNRNLQSYVTSGFLISKRVPRFDSIKNNVNLNWMGCDILDNTDPADRLYVVDEALVRMRNSRNYITAAIDENKSLNLSIKKHIVEFHRKFTLSFACIVLFFIGAPMGAIVRKGGLGMPMIISIIFFMIFHIISFSGEKLAKEGSLSPFLGMWLASFILVPMGAFLTYKAATDSALFDANKYYNFLKKFKIKKK